MKRDHQNIVYHFPSRFSLVAYSKRIYQYRSFLIALSFKWIRIKYEESHLGMLWIIINPILIAIIYSLSLGWALRGTKSSQEYFLFVYAGLILWQFFRDTFLDTADCMLREPNVLKRANFPKILVPLSVLIPKLLELIVGYTILLVIITIGNGLPVQQLVLLPILIIDISLICLGIGMMGIYFFTRYRDVKHFLRFIFPFFIYTIPVLYDENQVPASFRDIFEYNPIAKLLIIQRGILFSHQGFSSQLVQISLISLGIFVLGAFVFIRNEHDLIDYI